MIDEAFSSAQRQICPGPLIVKEKVLPAFYPRMSGMSQEFFILTFNVTPRETLTRFLIAAFNKGMQVTMEPPGYPLVTATTLTSCLAYLRQAMAMLHVVGNDASISILLDI